MEPDIKKEDKKYLHDGGEHSDTADAGQAEAEYSIRASDILEFLFCPQFIYFRIIWMYQNMKKRDSRYRRDGRSMKISRA